jgi:hypothetical protein
MRIDNDCLYLNEEMFQEELSWNAFVFNDCYDKAGRPIFFLRFENWNPVVGTER